ncbi:FG-GAP repeat domain-containing protein [Kocuria sp. M4R2S49]|uniref:FG-GAP repeat domain-containing protein n=1 Tax=Kocuria rhizosphaericola TaxID=3376284 RepID=UPI0037AC8D22
MKLSTPVRLVAGASTAALVSTGLALGSPAHASHTTTAFPMFSYTDGWRVDQHVRELGDVNGDGIADIVGFGDPGVFVAYGQSDTTFTAPTLTVQNFGTAQGWNNSQHVRTVTDVDGDGREDLVGFGDAGVYVSYAEADGSFTPAVLKVENFGYDQGWRVDRHPREVADLAGDGTADIVGFGNAGVHVAFGQPAIGQTDQQFEDPVPRSQYYGYDDGWRVDQHPRELADMDGDGALDIVGFGDAGAYVSYFTIPFDPFTSPELRVPDFGSDQGWRVGQHPRELGDVNGDGAADIVGFGHRGVLVSYAEAEAERSFSTASLEVEDFGYVQGWRGDRHLRTLGRLNADETADVVGFGDTGVHVAHGLTDNTFGDPFQEYHVFGYNDGWTEDRYPRKLADVNGRGQDEVVGFGHSATYVGGKPTPAAG